MTERALSETAMLASLRDIELPVEASGGMPADLAATVGLAGCLALVLAAVLRGISLRRKPAGAETAATHRARLASLPEAERRVAMLHLLRARAPERFDTLRGMLYRPEGGVDIATLEAEVNRLV